MRSIFTRYFFIVLLFITVRTSAQVDREFWFAIPKETPTHGCIGTDNTPNNGPGGNCFPYVVGLKIANVDSVPATVTISMPANPAFIPIVVNILPGQAQSVPLASSWIQFAAIYSNIAASNSFSLSGQTNRGLLIQSNNDITCYYDYDNFWNRELYSLKGKNALGTDFYAPFQSIWDNGNYAVQAYSDIDIVATTDGTQITVYPTQPIQGFAFPGAITLPTLNRGQTYTLRATGFKGNQHLGGTRILVTSGGKIAVTINDDSVIKFGAGCEDIIGDQLVPTDVIGAKYLVMTGNDGDTDGGPAIKKDIKRAEQIFVTATQPLTHVIFKDTLGAIIFDTIMNAGKSTYISPERLTSKYSTIYVESDNPLKPICVLHVTGHGCELGGAILPPITDCTGSTQVTVFPSSTGNAVPPADWNLTKVTINLMVRYDTTLAFTDPTQAHYHFTLINSNGSYAIPGTDFEPNRKTGWAILKMAFRDFGPGGLNKLVLGANKFVNSVDYFHLGMSDGTASNTNKYGYFSSFNVSVVSARVASTETPFSKICLGQKLTLIASGGFKYLWHYGTPTGPGTYLDDRTSATPTIIGLPVGNNHNFYVDVKRGKCFHDTTLHLWVRVYPQSKALFDIDKIWICPIDSVHFINLSQKADSFTWTRTINGITGPFFRTNNMNFYQTFKNFGSTPLLYRYNLTADSLNCADTTSKTITVYPSIIAGFSATPDTIGCHPLTVKFTSTNYSVGDLWRYDWEFGDQGSSDSIDTQNTFQNFGMLDTIYHTKLIVTSPYYCTDTARQNITVHPFIKALFTADTVKGCSPLTIEAHNNSLGAIDSVKWDFGDGTFRTFTVKKDTLMHTYPINTLPLPNHYKLLLTVWNAAKCSDTISRTIMVNPQTSVSFTPIDTMVCDSTLVHFRSHPSAAVTHYLWDFGDGGTSGDQNPAHWFYNHSPTNADVPYLVHLTVMSNQYCNGDSSTHITVHSYLDPQFTVNMPTGCAPFNAVITNTSKGGITNYKWDFGDGTVRNFNVNKDTLIHTYQNTTTASILRTIRLEIRNSGGCMASLSRDITVKPEIKANFTRSIFFGCNPLTVTFTYPNLNLLADHFVWDFGDSTSSSIQSPTHLFTNLNTTTRTFPVTLTASSTTFGCSASDTLPIAVYPFIEANFTIDNSTGCSPLIVNITNNSRGGIASSAWDYGNGNGTGPIPSSPRTYINTTPNLTNPVIRLVVSTGILNGNCTNTYSLPLTIYPKVNAIFTVNPSEGCNPLNVTYTNSSGPGLVPVEYKWAFGDSSSSVVYNRNSQTHQFTNLVGSNVKTFTTKLTAYSQYRCWDTITHNIMVYPYVLADFAFDKAAGCSPYTITINNASLPLSSGTPRTRNDYWMFGDGFPSTNILTTPFTHTYTNTTSGSSIYNCRLIVAYNRNGTDKCFDTIIHQVEVYPKVTALFDPAALEGCHPLPIQFVNHSIFGPGPNLPPSNKVLYDWAFGDNGTSFDPSPTHIYNNFTNNEATYTVSLTATSVDYKCTNTITKPVIVHPKPTARFTAPKYISCPPFVFSLTNVSQVSGTYYWNFGDNSSPRTTITLDTVNHRYDNYAINTATYPLWLRVVSPNNCVDSTFQNITVYPRVFADFTPDTAGCSPLLVPFINKSTRTDSYSWNFGDNGTSNLTDPSNKFFNNSINDIPFTVSLISSSKFGCSDTATRQVTVYPQPEAIFNINPSMYLLYPDNQVTLINGTKPGLWSYLWDYGDGRTDTIRDPLAPHTYNPWGVYYITLKVWNSHCSDAIQHRLTIRPPVPISDFDAGDNGCVPLPMAFTNHSIWVTSWHWDFGNGAVSTDSVGSTIYEEPGIYQVKLTVTGDGGEVSSSRTIEVYPKPEVNFELRPSLVMLPDATVKFYNTSKYGSRFLWDFGDSTQSADIEPSHTYHALGEYTVRLNVWTINNCFDSLVKSKVVEVIGSGVIKFPNAFTPNINGQGDGKYTTPDLLNEVFHPYWEGVIDYHLEIYDRWGEKLFETHDINTGWDGYYKGKLCKTDVYVWKAKGKFSNDKTFDIAGNVTLIR